MRSTALVLSLLLLFSGAHVQALKPLPVALALLQTNQPTILQITLSTSSDVIRSGGPAVVTVSRKNITDHVVQYQRPKHPLAYTNFAVACQGKEAEERVGLRKLRDRASSSSSGPSIGGDIEATLGPGQVNEDRIDLNDYYLFPSGSTCTVSVIDGSAFHPQEAHADQILSNSIILVIQ